MDFTFYIRHYQLEPFVKDILVLENIDSKVHNSLPFYADGYPGVVFQKSEQGVILMPVKKELSTFFMYGQTVAPISLSIDGAFRMIVFQLYPFAAKALFQVNPKELKDDCYDLITSGTSGVTNTLEALASRELLENQIDLIASYLSNVAQVAVLNTDDLVHHAVNYLLVSNGSLTIKDLADKLNTTVRTLQRKFAVQVGLSPKKFAKIIQFQASMSQLSEADFSKLSDIVYENGYADQSHFIRNFKQFAGQKPSRFKKS